MSEEKTLKVFVLGISGSIGEKVLQRIEHLNELEASKTNSVKRARRFNVVGIAVRSSYKSVVTAALQYKKCAVVITNFHAYKKAKDELIHTNFKGDFFSSVENALLETEYDVLVNALVGSVGLKPTYMALKASKKVLLANKESLVMGGELLCKHFSVQHLKDLLVPIDSEHSAILHLLHISAAKRKITKLILTASGGPFFASKEKNPSVKAALAHPNWKMGKKISIDSATMMNKGLEVIEAHYLFNFPYAQIEVLIHPQSVIHSLVETEDGEQYAQVGSAEMGYAIQNALTYPNLCRTGYKSFSLVEAGALTFFSPDYEKFPLLKLAFEVGKKRKTLPAVMNAANEMAVNLFLDKKISFEDITVAVHNEVENHHSFHATSVEDLFALDEEIKEMVRLKFSREKKNTISKT